MTGLDLAELKRLEAAATPGPWFIHDFSGLEGIEQPKARDVTISCDHPATITVAEMGGGLDGHKGVSQGQYDAALIAALRNAALALIAKAERADKYQSDYAQLFDKMQGTPCAQIAWQQELDAANARIVELESKVYVPGLWKCAKCSFTLVQRVLRASDGAVGVRDNPFMPSGTAEEITRVADWLQTKYSRDYGADRPGAIGMARGMIKAARGEIPAIPKRDEVVADDSLCSDCPPVNYLTDEPRCRPCPRRKIPCTGGDI